MSGYPTDRDNLDLGGAAAGRAVGILIRRGKTNPNDVYRKLRTRAHILRDMAPAVGAGGPGLPILRQRNVEWAADELDAAAEIIHALTEGWPDGR